MDVIMDKKEQNRKMIILKNICLKYVWDLPYLLRIDLSNFINALDKQISDNRVFIREYIEKKEKEDLQMSIYDYKD